MANYNKIKSNSLYLLSLTVRIVNYGYYLAPMTKVDHVNSSKPVSEKKSVAVSCN